MTTIPNELIINIKTSIPGYQTIRYNPSMTIKDISNDNRKVRFNPLIKLNKSTIDKIPKDIRKKQFFNEGLFESLLNYTNSKQEKNLFDATAKGNIDNNIRVTLTSIFPENSILYVGGKPYVIADLQWSNGDWKIDTKQKPIIFDSNKIRDPYLYQVVVKDEIISGQQELEGLPPLVVYGPNYVDKTKITNTTKSNNATGIKLNESVDSNKVINLTTNITNHANTNTSNNTNTNMDASFNNNVTALTIIQKPPLKPEKPHKNTQLSLISSNTINELEPYRYAKENQIIQKEKREEPEIIEEIKDKTIQKPIKPPPFVIESINKFVTSKKTTDQMKSGFSGNFYTLLNEIFKVSNEETKEFIQENLKETTTINIQKGTTNLSDKSYKESVSGIRTVANTGGGDCFFIAIADAINYYNYHNQQNRIISGRYGTGTNLYTQAYLRSLVYEFITTWPELDNQLENIAPVNTEEMNTLFSTSLKGLERATNETQEITKETYVDLAKSIYKNNENFLVQGIESVPIEIDRYYSPFRVIEKKELKKYIISNNYWANDLAIIALSSVLKLNVIPISMKINGKTGKYEISIPFANFTKEYNKWNRYLFLYYFKNHYELITFDYKTKIQKFNEKTSTISEKLNLSKKVIFHAREIPPIYILLTIFGATYSTIRNSEDKANFTFKQSIMQLIEDTINNKLYFTPQYVNIFYPLFKSYFTDSKVRVPINTEGMKGGAYPNNYRNNIDLENPYPYPYPYPYGSPYHYYSPYNRSYFPNNMTKPEYKKDTTQLAYSITIYMELYPGTNIPNEERKVLKCRQKWNSVRKAYADFLGKPYVIPPVYHTNKTSKNIVETSANRSRNNRPVPQNNTRKIQGNQKMRGGKTKKTYKDK